MTGWSAFIFCLLQERKKRFQNFITMSKSCGRNCGIHLLQKSSKCESLSDSTGEEPTVYAVYIFKVPFKINLDDPPVSEILMSS